MPHEEVFFFAKNNPHKKLWIGEWIYFANNDGFFDYHKMYAMDLSPENIAFAKKTNLEIHGEE